MHRLDVSDIQSPILIVSPHPDDDILGSGGLIQQALALKKQIFVLFMTTGDANGQSVSDYLHLPLTAKSYIDLGTVRHREAVNAERFLGVPASHLFFLGFPDGTMYAIATDKNFSRVHRSKFTGLSSAAYAFSYQRYAPYTHGKALGLFKSVFRQVKPKTVVVNKAIDVHPDHKAARILTLEAIRALDIHPTIYSYLIHYPKWPTKGTEGPLNPPPGVSTEGLKSLPLSAEQERRTREAYSLHKSQATLSTNNYNLIRSNELFWKSEERVRCGRKAGARARGGRRRRQPHNAPYLAGIVNFLPHLPQNAAESSGIPVNRSP